MACQRACFSVCLSVCLSLSLCFCLFVCACVCVCCAIRDILIFNIWDILCLLLNEIPHEGNNGTVLYCFVWRVSVRVVPLPPPPSPLCVCLCVYVCVHVCVCCAIRDILIDLQHIGHFVFCCVYCSQMNFCMRAVKPLSCILQYNFIAKCQYTDCTRNVLWCQVHSSHIHSNHKTTANKR